MAKWKYALERGGGKSLEISTGTFIWQKKTEVRLNGNLIGSFPSQKELAEGKLLPLPDGTTLRIQFVQSFFSLGFRVLRNDKPLPGSYSDPTAIKFGESVSIIYLIASIKIVLGFLAINFQVEFLQTLGFGMFSVAIGFILLVLGFFTQRRFLIALIIALIIYGLESTLLLFGAFISALVRSNVGLILMGMSLPIAVFTVRIFLLWWMGKGVGAINKLKKVIPPTVS
jgi:hypothetical protein